MWAIFSPKLKQHSTFYHPDHTFHNHTNIHISHKLVSKIYFWWEVWEDLHWLPHRTLLQKYPRCTFRCYVICLAESSLMRRPHCTHPALLPSPSLIVDGASLTSKLITSTKLSLSCFSMSQSGCLSSQALFK